MEKVRIQDDLFNYVNGEWLEKAEIPADRPTTGGFADLDKGVEETLRADIAKMIEEGKYPSKYLEEACKVYRLAVDVKKRKKDGLKPVSKLLKKIEGLKNVAALNKNLKEFLIEGVALPFNLDIDPDMKDTDHYLIYIGGPETILPDTTYYKEPMKAQGEAILGIWKGMVARLLSKTKLSEEVQASFIEKAVAFDARIAQIVKSSEEWSEYTKAYNIFTLKKAQSLLKPIKVKKVCEELFGEVEKVSITDPRFAKEFKGFFNEETFEEYKAWAYIKTLIGASSLLSEELREIGTSYGRALTGVKEMPKLERFAYSVMSGLFSEPIGIYYGDKYFGQEAKKDVVSMVKEIIENYKERISSNDFLEAETKAKAIKKLSTMGIKMGYPDKCRDIFDKLVVSEEMSLYETIHALRRIKVEDKLSKFRTPVDRTEWAMPGCMVNACYSPFSNDITFPAAILQAPFYSIKQTRSQNLGGIGAVIGHEISHAFDNNGALFDEKGNLSNWWTKGDLKAFKAKTKAMIKEFEGIELPWGKVNSTLIVSENIADNGGMGVTLQIMGKMKEKSYEEYFINWAKVWCMKGKPEYLALILNIDVHAPAILRANMQPRNFPEWYETFGVKSKDKMFIAPSKRVVIW